MGGGGTSITIDIMYEFISVIISITSYNLILRYCIHLIVVIGTGTMGWAVAPPIFIYHTHEH